MIDTDKQLLIELDNGIISNEVFLRNFTINIKSDADFVRNEMRNAIDAAEPGEIQMTISLIWLSGDVSKFVDLLNELLINPNHISHQTIAKALQDAPSPSTIPFVRKALESNFYYLEYTCSDSGVIAKWFSWLLYSIGTKEAIDLMEEYSHSTDEGIRDEMLYRLKKVQN